MKWFINLFGIQVHQLTVGSRVRTKHGMGTVIGGPVAPSVAEWMRCEQFREA